MIKESLDIANVSLSVLISMIKQPERLVERSWSSEFTCRMVKQLLRKSLAHPHSWLRDRQELLAMKGLDLLKVNFQHEVIAGVPCLRCTAKEAASTNQTLVYFHGGGYVVGSVNAYRYTLAKLALACGYEVVGVDYRRAPDCPIPAAQEDCLAVSSELLASSRISSLVCMGDSAGGALSVSTALALVDNDQRAKLKACVLLSPWTDPFENTSLEITHEGSDILDKDILGRWARELSESFVGVEAFSGAPLARLPRLYIQAAGAEVMMPQIEAFVERLKAQNVALEYRVYPGMFHVFQTFAPLVPEANDAIQDAAEWLKSL